MTQDSGLKGRLEAGVVRQDHLNLRTIEGIEAIERLDADSSFHCLLIDAALLGTEREKMLQRLGEIGRKRNTLLVLLEETSRITTPRVSGLEVISRDARASEIINAAKSAMTFELEIWGARGTLPVSGRKTLRYGGSTSCVNLRIGKDRHFIFDAGTGLQRLSKHVMKKSGGQFHGRLFITHPHWDHLNCIPFFEPLYIPGNRIDLMGPPHDSLSFRELLEGQMNGIYFPIKPDRFRAEVCFTDILEGTHQYDGVVVKAFRLDHPGYCLGYRIEHAGKSFAYITDNEIPEDKQDCPSWHALVDFLKDVDVLVHDTSYFDEEYRAKVHWGHSAVSTVVKLAIASSARHLFLFHHDPEHDDDDIDRKLHVANEAVSHQGGELICHSAREGDRWNIQTGLLEGRIR